MANWTVVDGDLADGRSMRVFLAEHDGELWTSAMSDSEHPKSEDEFEWRACSGLNWTRTRRPEGVLAAAAKQVREYFSGARLLFDVPLRLRGTDFQVRVWKRLAGIPFGSVQSYGEIAAAIENGGACRAVGNANGRNRLPLFIPCHRVIASGGKIGGFTGGLGLKTRLLAHEAAVLGRDLASCEWLAGNAHRARSQAAAQF